MLLRYASLDAKGFYNCRKFSHAKSIDAVHEEALDVVLTALNGEAGLSDLDTPFLCAALHFWRDELIERMHREHPDDLGAEKAAYILMKRHYQGEGVKVGGDE